MVFKLNRTGSILNRNERLNFNENWDDLEKVINDRGVEILSESGFLTWLDENGIKHREEVATFSSLPSSDSLNTVRGVEDENKIYIKKENGWVAFQTIDISKINEVERKTERSSNSQRSAVIYRNATSIRVIGRSYQMLGFRFMGQYYEESGLYFVSDLMNNIVSTTNDLGAETTVSKSNWYAIFAVGNNRDTQAQFKLMPFFRVAGKTGNILRFGEAGENGNPSVHKSYSMTTDVLSGSDVLVINETLDNRVNAFSGRTTKVVSNTSSEITLADAGTINNGDFILVSPPGFDNYRYLSTFYVDTEEIRNIADSGTEVATRGVSVLEADISNELPATGKQVFLSGFISPLATSGIVQIKQNLSTSSLGTSHLKIGIDATHDISDIYQRKVEASSIGTSNPGITIPFAYLGQSFNIRSSGTLQHVATRQVDVRGWIE